MKLKFLRAGLALGVAVLSINSARAYLPVLSDPAALPVAQNVYNYLATRASATTDKMIEGQHLGGVNEILHPEIYGPFDITSHAVNGKLPGMVGTRYDGTDKQQNEYILDPVVCSALNIQLISIWKSNQPVVHITAIPPNPWHPQSGRDPYKPTNNLSELLLTAPDSAAKRSFWASIDLIAAALGELRDAGIPVVFRPFAEFNMPNKYYYRNQSSATFVQLWQDVYNHYVGVKGLHNLIFCWEAWALNRSSTESDLGPWYPGDNYVDVVAGAYYFQPDIPYLDANGVFSFTKVNDQTIYDFLTTRNRPFGAAQWGLNQGTGVPGDDRFTLSFMNFCPRLAFAYYWTNEQAVEVQAHAEEFVSEPRVATAEDLPGFSEKTFSSLPAEDGWIREYSMGSLKFGVARATEVGTTALRTGDTGPREMDARYQSIVSFDTSTLPPGATPTGATLRLKRGALVGQNPFLTEGSCWVDIAGSTGFGGSPDLSPDDFRNFSGIVKAVATLSDPLADGNWSTGSLNPAGLTAINRSGRTQLRIYFNQNRHDGHEAFVGWYSGEAESGDQPELTIHYKYQAP